jgi:hypothetical protein
VKIAIVIPPGNRPSLALCGSEENPCLQPIIRLGFRRLKFDPRVLVAPVALGPPFLVGDRAGHPVDWASLAQAYAEGAIRIGRLESPLEPGRFPGHRVFPFLWRPQTRQPDDITFVFQVKTNSWKIPDNFVKIYPKPLIIQELREKIIEEIIMDWRGQFRFRTRLIDWIVIVAVALSLWALGISGARHIQAEGYRDQIDARQAAAYPARTGVP